MAQLATAVTLSGPITGGLGWALNWPWLFWIGTALCGLNLFLNLASGAMRFPLLPILSAGITSFLVDPWVIGAAAGLLIYTAIEGGSELLQRPTTAASTGAKDLEPHAASLSRETLDKHFGSALSKRRELLYLCPIQNWPGRELVDLDSMGDGRAWLGATLCDQEVDVLTDPESDEWYGRLLAEKYLQQLKEFGVMCPDSEVESMVDNVAREFRLLITAWRNAVFKSILAASSARSL